MNLTSFTDYSLRVLIMLGSDPDRKFKTSELTKFLGIKHNHATKVVYKLASLKYINSYKGRHGGVTIAKEAYKLKLSDVVLQLEPLNIVECFTGHSDCSLLLNGCKLKSVLNSATSDFINRLSKYTLLDICNISPENLAEL